MGKFDGLFQEASTTPEGTQQAPTGGKFAGLFEAPKQPVTPALDNAGSTPSGAPATPAVKTDLKFGFTDFKFTPPSDAEQIREMAKKKITDLGVRELSTKQALDKVPAFNNESTPALASGALPPVKIFGDIEFDPQAGVRNQQKRAELEQQYENLSLAKQIYQDIANHDPKDKSFFGDLAQGVEAGLREPTKLLPFIGSLDSLAENVKFIQALQKMQSGQKLSDIEQSYIDKYEALNAPVDRSPAYWIGATLTQLPTYAAEFALTGGVYTGAKTALTSAATKVLPEIATSKIGSKVLNLATSIVASTLQGSVNVPALSNKTAEYMLPKSELVRGENGELMVDILNEKGDDFIKAFAKAFGTQAVDYITERSGVLIEKPVAWLEKAVIGKWLAKNGIAELPKAFTKLKEVVGWNGIIGEVFEEELSNLAQAPIEGRDINLPGFTEEGNRRLLVEAGSIGIFGGLGELPPMAIQAIYNERDKAKTAPVEAFNEDEARARIASYKANEAKIEASRAVLDNAQTGQPVTVTGYAGAAPQGVDSGFRTTEREVARAYAIERNGSVRSYSDELKNPYVADKSQDILQSFADKGDVQARQLLEDFRSFVAENGGSTNKDQIVRDVDAYVKQQLEKQGYDSVIYRGTREYQVFNAPNVNSQKPKQKYSESSLTVLSAIEKSTGQKKVGTLKGVNFELGSFGKEHQNRKEGEGKGDRFKASELGGTIKHIVAAYRASDNPKNYRIDNVAWVAKMPNGELRAIYTRQNAKGAEEILSWHKINPETAKKYIETLASYGTPARTRTGTTALEPRRAIQLLNGGTESVAQDKASAKRLTQKEKVAEAVKGKPKSIKEVATETNILEPNVRRILGVGAKEGTFERVAEGVYVLKNGDGTESAYIEIADAKDALARMAKEGKKFQSVILDPAYFSRALIGGNRGIKMWEFITPEDFASVMKSISSLVDNDKTHVYLMLSGARTAQADMQKYVKGAIDAGFKAVGEGQYTKTDKSGKPVTNVRGVEAAPERLILLTQSGEARIGEIPTQLNFRFVRPSVLKSYQTEKPGELMRALIEQSTLGGEAVLDPFAGSGVTGEQALETGRRVSLIEKGKTLTEEGESLLKKIAKENKLTRAQVGILRADVIAAALGQKTSGKYIEQVKQLSPYVTDVVERFTKPRVQAAASNVSERAAKARAAQYQLPQAIPEHIRSVPENSKFITNDEALRIINDYFNPGELGVEFVDKITTPAGLEAFGKYSNKMIQFINNPNSTTPHHEAVHAYLDLFTDKSSKADILKEVKEKYKEENLNDHSAEERLADDFVGYVRGKSEPRSKLKQFFDKVVAFLKKLAGRMPRVDRLYSDIIEKRRPRNITDGEFSTLSSEERDSVRFEHYQNPKLLTARIFNSPMLQGREELPIQFLRDTIKSGKANLKPAEQALLNEVLDKEFAGASKISKTDFDRKVQDYLLPFEVEKTNKWANYGIDRINPKGLSTDDFTFLIRTAHSHGTSNHFNSDDLFAHFRISFTDEDGKRVARVVEVQSDPFQKEGVDRLAPDIVTRINNQELEIRRKKQDVSDEKVTLSELNKAKKAIEAFAADLRERPEYYKKQLKEDSHAIENKGDEILKRYSIPRLGLYFWGDGNKPLSPTKVADNLTDTKKLVSGLEAYQKDEIAPLQQIVEKLELQRQKVAATKTELLALEAKLVELQAAKASGAVTEEDRRAQQFLQYRNSWHEMAMRLAIQTAANDGADVVRFPTAFTATRIEDWDNQSGDNRGAGEYTEDDVYESNEIDIYGENYTIVSVNGDGSFEAVRGSSNAVYEESDVENDYRDQMIDEPESYGIDADLRELITENFEKWKQDKISEFTATIEGKEMVIKETADPNITEREKSLQEVKDGKAVYDSFRIMGEDYGADYVSYISDGGDGYSFEFTGKSADVSERIDKFIGYLKSMGLKPEISFLDLPEKNQTFVVVRESEYEGKSMFILNERGQRRMTEYREADLENAIRHKQTLQRDIEEARAKIDRIKGATEEDIVDDIDLKDELFESDIEAIVDKKMGDFDAKEWLEGSWGSVYEYTDGRGDVRYIVFENKTDSEYFDAPSDIKSADAIEDRRREFEGEFIGKPNFTKDDIPLGDDYQGIAYRYETTFPKYLEKYRGKANVKRMTDPNGFNWFETELKPEDKGAVEAFQTKKQVEKSALEKIGARVVSDNTEEGASSFLNFAQKFRTEAVDNVYPLEVLAQKAGKEFTAEDPSLFARLYGNVSAIVVNNFNSDRGYWGWTGAGFEKLHDFNWKTLIKGLGKSTTDFGNWLVARRARADFQRLDELETTRSQYDPEIEKAEYEEANAEYQSLKEIVDRDGFDRDVVEQAYTENEERFAAEAKMYDTLVSEDLKFLNRPEVGLVNEEQYRELTSRTGYASFKRAFFDELTGEDTGTGTARIGGTKVSALLNRKGSDKQIVNPLYNAIKNHGESMKKGLKQMVYNRVVSYAEEFPELFRKEELKVVPIEGGGLMFPQEKDQQTVMARVNYVRTPYTVDPLIKRTLDEVLNYQNMHVFERLLRSANSLFTKGTTGLYPGFSLSNFGVDQITAVAQTRNKYIPLYDQLKTVLNIAMDKKGEDAQYFQEYLVLGGERQTFVGWQDLTPNQLFEAVTKEVNGLMRVANALNKGMDVLALPSKWSEIATRATEYVKSRKAGKPQVVALEEAGRVTAPFHHVGRLGGGRIGQSMVKSIPFFNPALQVLDQVARQVTNDPASRRRYAFTALAVTAALAGSFAYISAYGSDDQKQLYLDLQPDELAKYIYMPHPNGKSLIRIRIPDQMATFGTLFNMAMADMNLNANYKVGDYFSAAFSFLPQQLDVTQPDKMLISWIPQLFKPAIQVMGNFKDFPRVMPLESEYQKYKPSELRYTDASSPVSKYVASTELAKKLDLSPIKIDYLLTGYLGRAVGFATGKPGIYNPVKSLTRDYYFTSGRRLNEFYDIRTANDQDYYALKHNLKKFTPQERNNILKVRQQVQEIDKVIDEYRKVELKYPQSERIDGLRTQILNRLGRLL